MTWQPFESDTFAEAFARPGSDTRQWGSYGTVDQDTPQQRSVVFTKEYGPLVSVTLQPSGIPVRCRVASFVAGNGEGSWYPFLQGDEVFVAIPEGSEDAGCVIVGRMNQEIDAWPTLVAGNDPTTNTFGFLRMRTPFVVETASSYLIRSAATGAFLGITAAGAVTISNADGGFLALGADFLGLQSGDASLLMQLDLDDGQVVLEAKGTKLVLDAKSSTLYSTGLLQIGMAGNQAAEHATSVEAVANLLASLLTYLGSIAAPGGAGGAAALATALVAFSTPALAQAPVASAVIPAAASLAMSPALTSAIAAALAQAKVPGEIPGVGAPGILIG